jgi:hypothetical protein
MKRAGLAAAASFIVLGLAAPASAGNVTVGSGSTLDLGSANLDLGEAGLNIAGTFAAGTATVDQARDVSIQPGGTLNGESATLNVCGDWSNSGTFNAGSGSVNFVDGCGLTLAVISGNTTFAGLSMTTATAKEYRFTAGSTQTVTGLLSLLGSAGNLLQIRSTLDGSEAFLNVQGGSSADFVDIQDIAAAGGNSIVLGPNSVKGTNTPGWLSAGVLVPLLGPLAPVLLALLLLVSGQRWLLPRSARADHAL